MDSVRLRQTSLRLLSRGAQLAQSLRSCADGSLTRRHIFVGDERTGMSDTRTGISETMTGCRTRPESIKPSINLSNNYRNE